MTADDSLNLRRVDRQKCRIVRRTMHVGHVYDRNLCHLQWPLTFFKIKHVFWRN